MTEQQPQSTEDRVAEIRDEYGGSGASDRVAQFLLAQLDKANDRIDQLEELGQISYACEEAASEQLVEAQARNQRLGDRLADLVKSWNYMASTVFTISESYDGAFLAAQARADLAAQELEGE